ncbi:unnamed protein product [Trichobilharzia szidati]|nr:unnamed protein product [Trichobilharzia szidati]
MSNSAFGPVLSSGIGMPNIMNSSSTSHNSNSNNNSNIPSMKEEHTTALGLKAIYAACRVLYPDQPTPLQVTAVRKFWMGGPDPLDFINMYANPGSVELQSPSHWHYVTNGLSDLYGDSRLHSHSNTTDGPSGFGFELTFRVKREPGETNPPTWPAHLLQSLARYVFYSQAQLMAGDHIPWPTSLDKQPNSAQQSEKRQSHHPSQQQQTDKQTNTEELENARKSIAMAAAATAASILAANSAKTGMTASTSATLSALTNPSTYASMVAAALAAVYNNNNSSSSSANNTSEDTTIKEKQSANNSSSSRIHHMLLIEDPQLKKITTPYGYVQFLQLVGLCDEELRLVQRWTGSHVAELMSCSIETGGGLLVTDMRRNLSLFELQPNLVDYINEKLKREGSNLSGVTTSYFAWSPITLSALGELLPGELESRRLRRQTQKHDCPSPSASLSTSCLYTSKTSGQSLSKSILFPNYSSTHKSDTDIGSKTIAMDTDDTLVSYAVKKRIEEDEFVDIVGGNGGEGIGGGGGGHVGGGGGGSGEDVDSTAAQKLTSENYIHSSTTAIGSMSPEVNSSLKMSRFESKSRILSSMSNRNAAGGTDGQTISAPGGFSAWCGRVGPMDMFNQSPFGGRHGMNKTGGNSCASSGGVFRGSLVTSPTELTNSLGGALGFKTFNSELPTNMITDKLFDPTTATTTTTTEPKGSRTPGTGGGGSGSTTGDGSAPCTPLAHLSLSPASLDMMPTRVIDYLDVHLCREAGEMLPLAVNDRLRHGRHFTFLNANYPDHAITLVPTGVSGAFVSEETPYVARGPWLQILLTDDFLEQLEFQFSCLLYPDELRLPLVFRWPERHLRICLIDVNSPTSSSVIPSGGCGGISMPTNPLPSSSAMSSTLMNSNTPTTPPTATTTSTSVSITPSHPQSHPHNIHSIVSKASNSPCNWNISSMFENKLLSTSGTPSSVIPPPQQRQQQQQNAFTKTDLLFPSPSASSSLFSSSASLFPPGCIPPPNVLASLFSSSAASNMNSNNNNSNSGSIHRSTNTTTSTTSNIPSSNTTSNNNESSQTELLRNPFLQSITSLQQTPLAPTMPVPSPVHPQQPQSSSLPCSTDSGVMMKMDPTVFMNNWSTFLQTLMNNSGNADLFRQTMFGGHPSNPSAYFMEIMQSILNNSSSSSSNTANNNSGTNPSVMLHHPLTAITSSGGGGGGGGAGLPSAGASSAFVVVIISN